MSSTKRHTYRPGDAIDPGATYYPMDGSRQGDPLEPDDVIAALDAHMEHTDIVDAMAQEIENLRAELDGRAPVSPAEHWSPWLEWRGGPCPLPPESRIDVEFRNGHRPPSDGSEAMLRWTNLGFSADVVRFRYRTDNPAGWLPRGDWIPPAELWDAGCPVRCEWINAAVDSSVIQREQMTPSTWSFATHIRLVAREAKAPLATQPEPGAVPELPAHMVGPDHRGDYWMTMPDGTRHLIRSVPGYDGYAARMAEAWRAIAARERVRRAQS